MTKKSKRTPIGVSKSNPKILHQKTDTIHGVVFLWECVQLAGDVMLFSKSGPYRSGTLSCSCSDVMWPFIYRSPTLVKPCGMLKLIDKQCARQCVNHTPFNPEANEH